MVRGHQRAYLLDRSLQNLYLKKAGFYMRRKSEATEYLFRLMCTGCGTWIFCFVAAIIVISWGNTPKSSPQLSLTLPVESSLIKDSAECYFEAFSHQNELLIAGKVERLDHNHVNVVISLRNGYPASLKIYKLLPTSKDVNEVQKEKLKDIELDQQTLFAFHLKE